jgi:uracil-DNA glycosylase
MTDSWPALAAEITACTACAELAATRQRVVIGDPAAAGGLVLVGEAPGAAEDAAGRPFVGKAGQLLDRTLAEVGLDRSRPMQDVLRGGREAVGMGPSQRTPVAVLNVLKCRPPENRAPKPDEVANCRPYLERQLALLAPSLVVALGLTAVTWLLGRRVTLAGARGTVHDVTVAGAPLRMIATYHPSAAIRFGPNGAPMAALREDLAYAAKVVAG